MAGRGSGSGQNGPRPGAGAGSAFSLAAAAPLAQIRSPGPGMDRRTASSIQRRISRGSGGSAREDGLALVPRDVGARLKSLQDEVRDVRRENQRLREGISKEEIQSTSGKGGELENHLLRHALKKTKEELHEERTILAQNRETHLLQQLEKVMQEKTKLSAMVDELTQENCLLKDKWWSTFRAWERRRQSRGATRRGRRAKASGSGTPGRAPSSESRERNRLSMRENTVRATPPVPARELGGQVMGASGTRGGMRGTRFGARGEEGGRRGGALGRQGQGLKGSNAMFQCLEL